MDKYISATLLVVFCCYVSVLYSSNEKAVDKGGYKSIVKSSCYLNRKVPKKNRPNCNGHKAAAFLGNIVQDVFYLHRNLFSWDSVKVITTIFPFYIASRIMDEKLQNCFYDARGHKNKNQMPKWCHELAEWSIGVPIIFLGQNAFFSKNENLQMTSRIFLIGMPFVIWSKDLIKRFEFDACWRPWNEKFSCNSRSHGGFPSGHMAEATFMAILYGMRFGPKFAVPLGALAFFVGTTFLTCNRHYASQLVAGAAFGTLYALAADKLIEQRLAEKMSLSCTVNNQGYPAVNVSYRF